MSSFPYDIRLTIGANKYGFMLVTPPGQTKQLNVTEVGAPNSTRIMMGQLTQGEADRLAFTPEQDTPFAMADFTGGLGQLEFDGNDETSYWWGSGVCTHVTGRTYLAPASSSLAMTGGSAALSGVYSYLHTDGNRWDFAWEGPRLWRRDASNKTNAWATVYTADATITDVTVFNGLAIVAVPSSTNASQDYVTISGITGAVTATARNHSVYSNGTKPKFWVASRNTLFALVDYGKVFYTVDPTQDSWLGPIQTTVGSITKPQVGDGSYAFVEGVAVNDYIFALRTDAGYNIDAEQNVTETFWQWKDKPSGENFKHVAVGGDLLLYSVGPEIYTYDPGTGTNLPLKLSRRDGFSIQSVLGLAADNQYAYVLASVRVPRLRSSTSIALLRGFRASGTRWAWECLWEDTNPGSKSYYRLAAVPNGVGTRLYWGLVSGGASSTYLMDIPADWDESTGSSFQTTGELYCSITRGGFPGFGKRHLWVSLEAEGTTVGGNKVAVAYSTDYGNTFTALGDTDTASGGILKLDYSDVHSRSIVLRFTLTSSAGTSTPILRVFDHHQRVRFRYLPAVNAGIRVANNLELLNGSREVSRGMVQLRADLETCRQSEAAILYEDFIGNSFYVSVDSLSYRPTRHESPTDKGELEALIAFNRADSGV